MPRPKNFPRGESATQDSIEAVIQVLDNWFWMIEDGTAQKRFPNPKNKIPKKEVDEVISYIDKEIDYEVTQHTAYFGDGRGIHEKADFRRLKGTAREAFVQDVLAAKEKYGIPRKGSSVYGVI
jgi:hypothetical protein